jgi:hypothetical protein
LSPMAATAEMALRSRLSEIVFAVGNRRQPTTQHYNPF